MNDALDALRSFRPEAVGPTDALQLEERIAFMETLAHATTRERRRVPRLRARRGVLLGIAIALVAAVGTASATGMIPDDVQQALGLAAARGENAALTPQVDQAVERASAPTADGGTLELWTAPTKVGGTCAYLRRLDATGAPADSGPISCAVRLAGGGMMGSAMGGAQAARSHQATTTMSIGGPLADGRLSAQLELDANGAGTLFGQVPGNVAKVEVVDAAGAVLAEAAAKDGWFLLTLPAGAASTAVSLVAQSASGASIDTVSIAPPTHPTESITGSGSGGSGRVTSGTGTAPG
jgi:hypothetical protein